MRKVVVDIHANAAARERLIQRSLGPKPRKPVKMSLLGSVTKFLVDHKLLKPSQARAANMSAAARGVPVARVLGEQGAVPQDKIVEAIDQVDPAQLSGSVEFDVRLPRHILRDLRIVCHAQTDKKLMVSSLSHFNLVKQMLEPYADGREIVAVPFSWQRWVEFEQDIDRIIEPDNTVGIHIDDHAPRSIVPDGIDDAEVLDILIDKAAHADASDIHIEPGKDDYDVYFRIRGIREGVHTGKHDQLSRVCAMVKDRSGIDPMETRIPQDGSFSTQVRGKAFDIRVATVPVHGKEKLTLRLLDPVRARFPLEHLGITEVDTWRRICEYRNGLVLIVGATGSGKTTTLNATVMGMNRLEKCIYTAEDPVEYQIDGVNHVQMNEAVGLNFASAIKAFMRGDPDVIILGEIRDPITAAKAIQAAETGHLVIATIHAESVPMALQRLRGLDVKKEDVEMLLRGVLVQFLLRTICQHCNGAGCEKCYGQGYGGRTVVSEIARVRTPADVDRMLSSDPDDKFWTPLWQDIESKIVAGVTDGKEVYRTFASELDEMAKHSEILAKVLVEERAKRDELSRNLGVAKVSSLSQEEKQIQRNLAHAKRLRDERASSERGTDPTTIGETVHSDEAVQAAE